jgi:hypothetical protein
MKATYLTAVTFLSLLACSAGTSPAPAPSPSATGTSTAGLTQTTPPVCPDIATSCPAGCIEAKASAYDPVAKCTLNGGNIMVVGCNAPFMRTTDVACGVRRADGMILFGSSSVVTQGGDYCSAEVEKQRTDALCP